MIIFVNILIMILFIILAFSLFTLVAFPFLTAGIISAIIEHKQTSKERRLKK